MSGELEMFLETGYYDFSASLVNLLHPLALRMIQRNRGWDEDFLIETAKDCLLIRKVTSAFLVILDEKDLNPPQSKHDILVLFDKLRTKINHRLYAATDPDEIEKIHRIQNEFMSGIYEHHPDVVENYLGYGEASINNVFSFLQFSNARYWTKERCENTEDLPNTTFHLMKPVHLKGVELEVAQEDPFLSHCQRVEALSRLWFEQLEMLPGGTEFIHFVQGNDWKQCSEWLKNRREPLDKVTGLRKEGGKTKRCEIPVARKVKKIKKLSGDVVKGLRARVFNTEKYGDINALIGETVKVQSEMVLEKHAERSLSFDLVPPPRSRVSSPQALSEFGTQDSNAPITQTVNEACDVSRSEVEDDVRELRDTLIEALRIRWRHWTLIPRAHFFETNNRGCQMLECGLTVFLNAIIEEGFHSFPSKLLDWLEQLSVIRLFEMSRATILFIASLYRIEDFHVVKVDEYLNRAVKMGATLFVDCVKEVAAELGQPPRARWFWRVIAQMLGSAETTCVLTLWREFSLLRVFDIERQNWQSFESYSIQIPRNRPEETQSLIDFIHADGLCIVHRKLNVLCAFCSEGNMGKIFLRIGCEPRRSHISNMDGLFASTRVTICFGSHVSNYCSTQKSSQLCLSWRISLCDS